MLPFCLTYRESWQIFVHVYLHNIFNMIETFLTNYLMNFIKLASEICLPRISWKPSFTSLLILFATSLSSFASSTTSTVNPKICKKGVKFQNPNFYQVYWKLNFLSTKNTLFVQQKKEKKKKKNIQLKSDEFENCFLGLPYY